MYKPKNHKDRVIHRLKISLGHLKKVISMVEDGEYCIDIIHQSQALQKAVKNVDELILENHLKTCAAKAIRSGKEKEAIAELMGIIKKS